MLITVDDNHKNLDRTGLRYKTFSSDIRLIRYITMLILKHAPQDIPEKSILEQQVSELIKNGAKHGNLYNKKKKLKVWYSFTSFQAHIIVEDEGTGFKEIDKWNSFKILRDKAFRSRKFKDMAKYAIWKGENSKEEDGGNSLFAATEYWNRGVVFNSKGNSVGVKRTFGPIHESSLLRDIS